MITKIAIENFKGIGDRVEIPIRPITLLFGPNSAGKSSILHAVQYAREVLERRNLDADQTINGGDFVDLGGFRNFVNRHDPDRNVVLRFDLALGEDELPEYRPRAGYLVDFEIRGEEETLPLRELDHELVQPKTGWVEVTISWSHQLGKPYVAAYAVGAQGKQVASIRFRPGRPEAELTEIDLGHEVFFVTTSIAGVNLAEAAYARSGSQAPPAADDTTTIPLHGLSDALPRWGEPLEMPSLFPEEPGEEEEGDDRIAAAITLTEAISRVVVGMGEVLLKHLRQFRYLGPLRQIPSREHRPPRHYDESRWAGGLAAWDELMTAEPELAEAVSDWLWRRDRLDTHYQLRRIEYKEIEDWLQEQMLRVDYAEIEDRLRGDLRVRHVEDYHDQASLLSEELQKLEVRRRMRIRDVDKNVDLDPQDVGVGLAQVIPVITALLSPRSKVVEIEQPDLHLHPTQEAALGDLLIHAALAGTGRILLIETHSEHMILRIQRRMRQTSMGQASENIEVRPEHVVVLYVEPEAGQTTAFEIALGEDGEFLQPWPDSFFDQDYRERFG